MASTTDTGPQDAEAATSPHLGPAPEGKGAKVPVDLTGVPETLLIPLASRVADAAQPRPILGDPYAKDVLVKLSYDFDKIPMPTTQWAGVALRTRTYDRWTASFLSAHPRATVLHLACGLDCRAQRVEWGSSVRWIDVELPEVVALRRQVLPDSLPGRDYRIVAASVTETAWLDEIPADAPTIVVMEGLLSYLEEKDARGLLLRLVEKFGEGELLFDCMSSWALSVGQGKIEAVKRTGAEFRTAFDDPKDLEDLHPSLKMQDSISFTEAPGVEEFPLKSRFLLYCFSWIPSVRSSSRFVRFAFGTNHQSSSSSG